MWSKRAQESWLAGVKAATAGVVSFPRPDEYAVTLSNVLFGIVFESSMFGSRILSEPKYYVFPHESFVSDFTVRHSLTFVVCWNYKEVRIRRSKQCQEIKGEQWRGESSWPKSAM